MESENQMGPVTQLAYNCIAEDLLIRENGVNVDDILDHLQDPDNFKRLSVLLEETMIKAGFLKDTGKTKNFAPILYSLLSGQEEKCKHYKRKTNWNRSTIRRWLDNSPIDPDNRGGQSESIKNRDDAVAICFALGLDYPSSQEFLNKSGHAILNIRNSEDAVYMYCLLNHRPFAVAKEIIYKYNTHFDQQENTDSNNYVHSGNTTITLIHQIMGNSNWETDDDFYTSFLLPNRSNFISYNRTTLQEYYKIKNPIYLITLKKLVDQENNDPALGHCFNRRKKQEYIHKQYSDLPIIIPLESVQITYNFINALRRYADSSVLIKTANDRLDIHPEHIIPTEWDEDCFRIINNTMDVIEYIISEYNEIYSKNENERKIISDFLSDTIPADKMLETWLPSLAINEQDGKEYYIEIADNFGKVQKKKVIRDSRQNRYSKSSLDTTVLRSFPHRDFFTKYERNPEELVHDITIRKMIILLSYMNYARILLMKISDPGVDEEMEFGFLDFCDTMNEILEKCQLGTLYYANPFDWLILESIKVLDTYYEGSDENNPYSFINDVFEFSFSREKNL